MSHRLAADGDKQNVGEAYGAPINLALLRRTLTGGSANPFRPVNTIIQTTRRKIVD